jgi:hypothetical protein
MRFVGREGLKRREISGIDAEGVGELLGRPRPHELPAPARPLRTPKWSCVLKPHGCRAIRQADRQEGWKNTRYGEGEFPSLPVGRVTTRGGRALRVGKPGGVCRLKSAQLEKE